MPALLSFSVTGTLLASASEFRPLQALGSELSMALAIQSESAWGNSCVSFSYSTRLEKIPE